MTAGNEISEWPASTTTTGALHRLEIQHFAVAITAFGIGAVMAVMQALSRAGIDLPMRSERLDYLSVTAHGVLLALVFTTFFIMGLGYLLVRTNLGRIAWQRAAWVSFFVALAGTVMTTLAILSGTSTVLYTFYPPLQAHWTFYVGATLLVIGSWGWCAVMVASYRAWRRAAGDIPVPLPVIAGSAIWGRPADAPPLTFSRPLAVMPPRAAIWDRLGHWTIVAVVLIVAAYAVPIVHLYTAERFGSPSFSPF